MKKEARRMTREQRDNMKYQVYSASIHGMRPREIALAFNLSIRTVQQYLDEERRERIKEFQETEKENQEGSITFALDHIQALRSSMFDSIQKLKEGGGKNNNLGTIYNGLTHLIELEAKIRGILTTRVTGADGQGPVEVMAVADRSKMLEEVKALLSQEDILQSEMPLLLEGSDVG